MFVLPRVGSLKLLLNCTIISCAIIKMLFWDQIRSFELSKNTKYLTVYHGELSLIAYPDKNVKNWVPHFLLLTAQTKEYIRHVISRCEKSNAIVNLEINIQIT